jgi:hypothetical protein
MFWMDIDPSEEIEGVARVCASSKYSIAELEESSGMKFALLYLSTCARILLRNALASI